MPNNVRVSEDATLADDAAVPDDNVAMPGDATPSDDTASPNASTSADDTTSANAAAAASNTASTSDTPTRAEPPGPRSRQAKPRSVLARLGPMALRLRPWASWLGAAVAGLCLYASFAPLGLWFMAPVGIALLVAALRGRRAWPSFGLGLTAGFVFFFLLIDWASVATGTPLARLAAGATMALYIGVLGIVWARLLRAIGHRPWLAAPALAMTWVAMEQLRGSWPAGGMPWGTLAFGQVNGPVVHLAPYGSTQLVGLVVVATGVLLEGLARYLVLRAPGQARPGLARPLALGAASIFLLGAPLLAPLPGQSQQSIRVAFVQGHVPSKDELAAGQDRALTVTENLAKQTRQVEGKGADLVLWPESASDYDAAAHLQARRIVESASSRLGVPLLLGTQRYPEDYRYNDYVVWMPGSGPVGRYTKQHPVPFGEYMPLRSFFRLFTSAVDRVAIDMRAGNKPALLQVKAGQRHLLLATPICFEIGYTPIVAEAVRGGANVIVVPTNNASFGHSAESFQQFDMTRFQAIASGRTAIQVSTVGVSGIAQPDGRVRQLTKPWQATSRVAEVSLNETMTIASTYERHISIAVYTCGSALAGLALLGGSPHSPLSKLVARYKNRKGNR